MLAFGDVCSFNNFNFCAAVRCEKESRAKEFDLIVLTHLFVVLRRETNSILALVEYRRRISRVFLISNVVNVGDMYLIFKRTYFMGTILWTEVWVVILYIMGL